MIKTAGHGDAFGHSLGHGIGLAIHELPRVLAAGEGHSPARACSRSVEPGITSPARGGVRIEDLVVIEDGGVRNLTRAPKQMVISLEETDLINVGELRRGVNIELDGQLLSVIDFDHIKMGRGGAVARLKLRNLRTGAIYERTFPGEREVPPGVPRAAEGPVLLQR